MRKVSISSTAVLDELVIPRGRRRDLRLAREHDEPDVQAGRARCRGTSRIASCAAPSRVGSTSSACIERDVSTTRITVARSLRNVRATCGRASPARRRAQREHEEHGRDEAAAATAPARRSRGRRRSSSEPRSASGAARRASRCRTRPTSSSSVRRAATGSGSSCDPRADGLDLDERRGRSRARRPREPGRRRGRRAATRVPDTVPIRLALGAVRVRNPNACAGRRGARGRVQRTATVAVPGRTRTVRTRRVVGSPGGNAPAEVGMRCPPPAAGMQPMYGRKRRRRCCDPPTWVPKNVTSRSVVIPGLTGLPSLPRKHTSIARDAQLRVQPADDVAPRTAQLPLRPRTRGSAACRDHDPRARDRDAHLETVALPRPARGSRHGQRGGERRPRRRPSWRNRLTAPSGTGTPRASRRRAGAAPLRRRRSRSPRAPPPSRRAASRAPRRPCSAAGRRAPCRTRRRSRTTAAGASPGSAGHWMIGRGSRPVSVSSTTPSRRADEHGVHRNALLPRPAAPLRRARPVPPSRAPSEMSRIERGGTTPPSGTLRLPSRTESATASPIAVPSPGIRLSSAASTSARSSVGGTPTDARVENETTPTRNFSGTCARNALAASRAASSRVGCTSVGLHRARRVDREDHRRLLARDAHRRERPRDADDHRREAEQEDGERKVPQPSRRRGRSRSGAAPGCRTLACDLRRRISPNA